MTTVTPILENNQEVFSRYFDDAFMSYHLGHRPIWQGSGPNLLGLNLPVKHTDLLNLLDGRSADGAKQLRASASNNGVELGWWITFDAPPSLTVLWALAPEPIRTKLECAHLESVRWTLKDFEVCSNNWDSRLWKPSGWLDFPCYVFAKFTTVAAYDQTPQLRTNAFLFNLAVNSDGSAGRITNETVRKDFLDTSYDVGIENELWRAIGLFRQGPGPGLRMADVPQELVRRFTFDPTFTPHNSPGTPEKPLDRHQLFAAWQAQAENWGWSSRDTRDFLRRCQINRDVNLFSRKTLGEFKKALRFCSNSKRSFQNLIRDETSRPIGKCSAKSNDQSQSQSHSR